MANSEKPLKPSRNRKLVLGAWALAAFVVPMIVLLFIFQAGDRFNPIIRSKESVLRIDLRTMREVIDKYNLDKKSPARSLQELVDARYLRAIPVDPMTGQRDWHVEFDVATGISDVHSSSTKTSLNGTSYDTW